MNVPANANKRLAVNYFTMAANTTEQSFTFTTVDDYRDRYVDTLFVGLATAGIAVRLYVQGQKLTEVDLTRFAAGDAILKAQFKIPARQLLTVTLQDLAGSSHSNVPVVIGYYPDPSVGP